MPGPVQRPHRKGACRLDTYLLAGIQASSLAASGAGAAIIPVDIGPTGLNIDGVNAGLPPAGMQMIPFPTSDVRLIPVTGGYPSGNGRSNRDDFRRHVRRRRKGQSHEVRKHPMIFDDHAPRPVRCHGRGRPRTDRFRHRGTRRGNRSHRRHVGNECHCLPTYSDPPPVF